MVGKGIEQANAKWWTNWELAARLQESGRAQEVLGRWQSADENCQAVIEIVRCVFRAATDANSAHKWAERIVELHYPEGIEAKRRSSIQALRIYTLQGVTVGWNTALSVLLAGDGLVSNAAEGAAAQRYADEIFLAVVGADPEDAAAGDG